MNIRDIILQITENVSLFDYLGNFAVLNDELQVGLEDQVYLNVKEVYLLPGNITVMRVAGSSSVCSKGYHNLCPIAKSCSCSCHKDDVQGLTPR